MESILTFLKIIIIKKGEVIMKKNFMLFICSILIIVNVPIKAEEKSIQYNVTEASYPIYMNNVLISDINPLNINDSTYISLRDITQLFGVNAKWNDITRSVSIQRDIEKIRDDFLIVDDLKIIDFSKLPYDIADIFDCNIEINDDWDGRQYVTLTFDGLEMEYKVQEINGKETPFVMGYKITNPIYSTEKGISCKSSKSDIEFEYGAIGSNNDNEWFTYRTNGEGFGHTFIFDDENNVSEILFGTYSQSYFEINDLSI